jgi:LysM repeat protein
MKKSLVQIVLAVLLVVSCKSAPAPESTAIEPESTGAFVDAYQLVLPINYEGAQNYTVVRNESLTKIALKFYGHESGYFFPLIMAASKDKQTVNIVDPDLIVPGEKLVIPDLQKNLADPATKTRIKTLLLSVAKIYENRETKWASEVYAGLNTTAAGLE